MITPETIGLNMVAAPLRVISSFAIAIAAGVGGCCANAGAAMPASMTASRAPRAEVASVRVNMKRSSVRCCFTCRLIFSENRFGSCAGSFDDPDAVGAGQNDDLSQSDEQAMLDHARDGDQPFGQ